MLRGPFRVWRFFGIEFREERLDESGNVRSSGVGAGSRGRAFSGARLALARCSGSVRGRAGGPPCFGPQGRAAWTSANANYLYVHHIRTNGGCDILLPRARHYDIPKLPHSILLENHSQSKSDSSPNRNQKHLRIYTIVTTTLMLI